MDYLPQDDQPHFAHHTASNTAEITFPQQQLLLLPHSSTATPFPIDTFNNDICYCINSFLTYPESLSLHRISRAFHLAFNPRNLPPDVRNAFLRSAEQFRCHRNSGPTKKIACFHCVNLKPPSCFSLAQRKSPSALHRRFCLECAAGGELLGHLEAIRVRKWNSAGEGWLRSEGLVFSCHVCSRFGNVGNTCLVVGPKDNAAGRKKRKLNKERAHGSQEEDEVRGQRRMMARHKEEVQKAKYAVQIASTVCRPLGENEGDPWLCYYGPRSVTSTRSISGAAVVTVGTAGGGLVRVRETSLRPKLDKLPLQLQKRIFSFLDTDFLALQRLARANHWFRSTVNPNAIARLNTKFFFLRARHAKWNIERPGKRWESAAENQEKVPKACYACWRLRPISDFNKGSVKQIIMDGEQPQMAWKRRCSSCLYRLYGTPLLYTSTHTGPTTPPVAVPIPSSASIATSKDEATPITTTKDETVQRTPQELTAERASWTCSNLRHVLYLCASCESFRYRNHPCAACTVTAAAADKAKSTTSEITREQNDVQCTPHPNSQDQDLPAQVATWTPAQEFRLRRLCPYCESLHYANYPCPTCADPVGLSDGSALEFYKLKLAGDSMAPYWGF